MTAAIDCLWRCPYPTASGGHLIKLANKSDLGAILTIRANAASEAAAERDFWNRPGLPRDITWDAGNFTVYGNADLPGHDSLFNPNVIKALARKNSPFSNFLVSRLTKLPNDNVAIPFGKMFGEVYAGPLVLGFVLWLEAMARQDRVDELLLTSRDGLLVNLVYSKLFPQRTLHVFHCSRRALLFPALEHDPSWLNELILPNPDLSLREALRHACIDNTDAVIAMLAKRGMNASAHATPESVAKAISHIRSCPQVLGAQIAAEHRGCSQYFRKLGVGDPRRAIADTGWDSNSHKALEQLVGAPVKGYYLGAAHSRFPATGIRTFLFDASRPDSGWPIFSHCLHFLELAFLSDQSQLVSMSSAGTGLGVNFRFRPASPRDQARGMLAQDMRHAVIDFAEDASGFQDMFRIDDVRECLHLLFGSLSFSPASRGMNPAANHDGPGTGGMGMSMLNKILAQLRLLFH